MNLFSEYYGNQLARELGIGTPEPALVNISQELIDALRVSLSNYGINPQPGIGVGCQYFRGGFTSPQVSIDLTIEERAQAAAIYAFDLMVQNPDRRSDKPNCAFLGKDLVAFDFEMCFSFLLAILQRGEPWEVSKHGLGPNHFFYPNLKKHSADWDPFISMCSKLDAASLDQLFSEVPDSWQEWARKVREHVLDVIMYLNDFKMELQRSLL
jgi:hypothetical protein